VKDTRAAVLPETAMPDPADPVIAERALPTTVLATTDPAMIAQEADIPADSEEAKAAVPDVSAAGIDPTPDADKPGPIAEDPAPKAEPKPSLNGKRFDFKKAPPSGGAFFSLNGWG